MEILSWVIKNSLTKFHFYIRKNSVTDYLLMYFFKVKNQRTNSYQNSHTQDFINGAKSNTEKNM